jgi:O-antigen/teichoic acid export membrane protein
MIKDSPISLVTSKLRVTFNFLIAQGFTMVGNLAYGLLCVRLLPSSEFAKFVVLFAVQGTLVNLMDVSISGTLIPLIGEHVHDRQMIADYLATLRRISHWLYAFIAILTMFAFPRLVSNRGWSPSLVVLMIIMVLVSCWAVRVSAAYGAVMILLQDRNHWYGAQMAASYGSLLLLIGFWAVGWLNGLTAITFNILSNIFIGTYYYFRAERLLGTKGTNSKPKRRAIFRLALPNVPYAVFYALQGQITLFLITIFGHTNGVAGVGALSRLSQLFALFLQMNHMFVEPYFAKLPKERLRQNYITAVSVASLVCIGIALIGWKFSGLFLWILGPQYHGLYLEVSLVITASAVACVSDLLWAIHSARRFVYWANNVLNIILIVVIQVLFILHADLSTIRSVLWLNLATNSVTFLVNIAAGVTGFLVGPRRIEDVIPMLPEGSLELESVLDGPDMQSISPFESLSVPSINRDSITSDPK